MVFEDFYSPEEVEEMRKAGRAFPFQAPKEDRCSFQNQVGLFMTFHSPLGNIINFDIFLQTTDQYFIESGDKIRFFFEKNAIGPNNELLVPEEHSLNKVGHSLHVDHPVFRKYTFDNRIRELCWQLGLQRPAVAQSMYM